MNADFDCQKCGACCAYFRVSFYWAEADDAPQGTVPVALTQAISPHHRCMQGTASKPARCVALAGTVGEFVACEIYEHRSSSCREVLPGDPQCMKARQHHGLPVGPRQ
jgi:Fe-S-cluster containining protein